MMKLLDKADEDEVDTLGATAASKYAEGMRIQVDRAFRQPPGRSITLRPTWLTVRCGTCPLASATPQQGTPSFKLLIQVLKSTLWLSPARLEHQRTNLEIARKDFVVTKVGARGADQPLETRLSEAYLALLASHRNHPGLGDS